MRLHRLHLRHFRAFAALDLTLDPNLTILAGENNCGKTTVLDALRLLTAPLDDRRDLWARPGDVTRGAGVDSFAIAGDFSDLTDVQRGLNIAALASPDGAEITYGFTYVCPQPGQRRGKGTAWAGVPNAGEAEPDARDLIRHVHLPALRDALRTLSSGSSERIALIIRHLAGNDAVASLETAAQEAFGAVEGHPVLTGAGSTIQRRLRQLTEGVAPQDAGLSFVDAKLERLCRDLRFSLAEAGVDLGELAESGMGYANLLYMATVVAELDAAGDADLTLLLVEEPEAHLHPQLQLAVLRFLEECAERSRKKSQDPATPAGHIQVVVTTHSPNITAAASIDKTVVLSSRLDAGSLPAASDVGGVASVVPAVPPAAVPTAPLPPSIRVRRAFAIPVGKLGIDPVARAKLDRYLDVTRSALLFSRRALLVEGITEAILLRALGRDLVLEAERAVPATSTAEERVALEAENRRIRATRSRFDATCFVPIDGVDFEPYLRLLLTTVDGERLADRVVVITDRDPQLVGDRPAALRALSSALKADGALALFVGAPTLEAELLAAGNDAAIRAAFLEMHPQSEKRWDSEVAGKAPAERGPAFVAVLKSLGTRKGELAQRITSQVLGGAVVTTPVYLANAIREIARE